MVFPCAMGRWSLWLLPSETIPMAHEVIKGWRRNNAPLYSGLHDCSGP
jgi:hypothetical protein